MAVTEKSGRMKFKDKSGNVYLLLPVTTADNVDGLDERINEVRAYTASGTGGTTYTATVPGITALTAGVSFVMIPDTTSTSSTSCTLQVNGLTTKSLRVRGKGYTSLTTTPSVTNWLASGKPVRVTYDGFCWVVESFIPEDDKPLAKLVALTVAGWNSTAKTQTVTVSGILADESKQLIIPMPAVASMAAYNAAGIYCSAQAANKLTFTATTIPTAAISVYVVYQEVTTS